MFHTSFSSKESVTVDVEVLLMWLAVDIMMLVVGCSVTASRCRKEMK